MTSEINIVAVDVTCFVTAPDQPPWTIKFPRGTYLEHIKAVLFKQLSDPTEDAILLIYDQDEDDLVELKHAAQLCTRPTVELRFERRQFNTVVDGVVPFDAEKLQTLFRLCKTMNLAPHCRVDMQFDCVKIEAFLVNARTAVYLTPIAELVKVQIRNLIFIDPTALDLKRRVTRLIDTYNAATRIWHGTLDADGEVLVGFFVPFPSSANTFDDFITTLLFEQTNFFGDLLKVYTGDRLTGARIFSNPPGMTRHFRSVDGSVVVLDVDQKKIDELLPKFNLPTGITQFARFASLTACTIAGVKDGQLWVNHHPRDFVNPLDFDAPFIPISDESLLPYCNPTSFTIDEKTFDASDVAIQKFIPGASCGSVLINGGRYFVIMGVLDDGLYARPKGNCRRLQKFAPDFNFSTCQLRGVTQIGSNTKIDIGACHNAWNVARANK